MNRDILDSILKRLANLEDFVKIPPSQELNIHKMQPGQKAKTRNGSVILFIGFDYESGTFPFIFRVGHYDFNNGSRSKYQGYDQFGVTFLDGGDMDIVEILPAEGD